MTEPERVAEALIEYRDNPPMRDIGAFEGRFYQTGDIMAIVMFPVVEFTTHEYITRLAALMLGPTSRETEYLAHSVWAARSEALGRRLYKAEKRCAEVELENAKLRTLLEESLMDTRAYAEKYGIDPSYDSVNEHLDSRLRELGIGG